jgi:hypothetical protein
MNKFIINLSVFCIIFFTFDKLFIFIRNYSAKTEIDKRLELLINGKITKTIVVVGSSRGARDIIAGKIQTETGQPAYNLCYPGSNIYFHEFLVRSLIKFNKTPKQILLVVDDPSEFHQDKTLNFRLDRMYPLVKYSYIRKELINRGEKNKWASYLFILHQINKSNFDFNKKQFSSLDTIKNCGSMPISFQRKGRNWKYGFKEDNYSVETEIKDKVEAFNKIIDMCNENKIGLTIIFPPNYKPRNTLFENRIKELTNHKENVSFMVYNDKNPIYSNKNYFYDESHLMNTGADIFTEEIVLCLREKMPWLKFPTGNLYDK